MFVCLTDTSVMLFLFVPDRRNKERAASQEGDTDGAEGDADDDENVVRDSTVLEMMSCL